jgi:hypothetical protein
MENKSLKEQLIAPCGMNCALCSAYLALKNDLRKEGIFRTYCEGCRIRNKECAFLKKRCPLLLKNKIAYCYECPTFPCKHLQTIDKRYRGRYHMSMIENLKYIKANGISTFLKDQRKKWKCPTCDGNISCHNGLCFKCDLEKLKRKHLRYSWD